MMNGSRTLEGFVPDVDATVVSRILDAGGHIVGKVFAKICVVAEAVLLLPLVRWLIHTIRRECVEGHHLVLQLW